MIFSEALMKVCEMCTFYIKGIIYKEPLLIIDVIISLIDSTCVSHGFVFTYLYFSSLFFSKINEQLGILKI